MCTLTWKSFIKKEILLNMAMVYLYNINIIKRRSWWVFNKYKLRWMTMMLCILVFIGIFSNKKKRKRWKKRKENGENERKGKKNYFQVYCTFKFVDILTLTYMHIYKAYMPKLKVLFFLCVLCCVYICCLYMLCSIFICFFLFFFTLLLFLLYDEHTQITQS